jgi:hypothetical protein
VNGAAVCDLDEALAILVVQRALDVDLANNAAEHSDVLFRLLAVLRVDPVVTEADVSCGAGVGPCGRRTSEGHRGARAERGEQESVGVRPGVGSAEGYRLIGEGGWLRPRAVEAHRADRHNEGSRPPCPTTPL